MNQRTNECEWVSGWVVESVIITKRTERKFRPKPSLSPPPLLYTVCLCLYYIRGVRSPSLPRLWEMIIVWDELLVFSFKSKELFPVSKEVRSPMWVGSVKLPGPGIYWLTCCLYHVTLLELSEHSDYSQPGLLMVWRFEGEGAWHPHVSMFDNITHASTSLSRGPESQHGGCRCPVPWVPSQCKDRLSQVWGFPC